MASHPPGSCCLEYVKHEGTPTGSIKTVGGIETYVATPKSGSTTNAVLILTDVFGHKFLNNQLIADQYAANGYFAVMPDLFNNDPVPEDAFTSGKFDLMAWLPNHQVEAIDPIVTAVIKDIKTTHSVSKIGASGYCFGAKYVIRYLGATGDAAGAKVDVGYVAHPSFVETAELQAITGPLSIAAAETDNIFPDEKRHESEGVLKKLGEEKKLPWQINLYGGTTHGFAVKGDMSVPQIKFGKEQAFFQAVQWYQTFLK